MDDSSAEGWYTTGTTIAPAVDAEAASTDPACVAPEPGAEPANAAPPSAALAGIGPPAPRLHESNATGVPPGV